MGSMFGGSSGGGAGGGQQTVQYVQPPAPGTIQQTILSGSPNPNPSNDPMDYIQRQRKQALGRLTDALGLASGSLGGG